MDANQLAVGYAMFQDPNGKLIAGKKAVEDTMNAFSELIADCVVRTKSLWPIHFQMTVSDQSLTFLSPTYKVW